MSQIKKEQDKESGGHSREPTVSYHESEMKYFQAERDKLQSASDHYLSETKKPDRKEYTPYVFNTLEPYADLRVYNTALDEPLVTERYQYKTRTTASGLCDPWISYNMDVNFQVDPTATPSSSPDTARPASNRSQRSDKKERNSARDDKEPNDTKKSKQDNQKTSSNCRDDKEPDDGKRSKQENQKTSSNPLFPTVKAVPNELTGKQLNYSHVPQLREELRKTYSVDADRRMEESYKLTKDEFHRRRLDRVDEYHPDTWPTMRLAYFAYLQNNRGSTRAVHECVRDAEKENRKGGKQTEKQQKTTQRSVKERKLTGENDVESNKSASK